MADTTVIDGSRITTGTIDAARISITGLDISELNNDEGYALDTDIPDVSSFQTAAEVTAAIAADTTVIDGSRITTGTMDAARISATTALVVGTGDDSATLSGADAEYRMWAGDANAADAPFSVKKTGEVSIKTATTGGRLELNGDTIEIYDATNTLRVKLGQL